MEKEYKQIYNALGGSIETAVLALVKYVVENNGLACIDFNGEMLYSDTVSLDSASKQIVGKTYTEYVTEREEELDRLRARQNWDIRGRAILPKNRWDAWFYIVNLYKKEKNCESILNKSLDLVEALINNDSFEEAEKVIFDEKNSDAPFAVVCSIILGLCDKSQEFVPYIVKKMNS